MTVRERPWLREHGWREGNQSLGEMGREQGSYPAGSLQSPQEARNPSLILAVPRLCRKQLTALYLWG